METFLILISIYILTIFISRWLNIQMFRYGYSAIPFVWFIPFINIIVILIVILMETLQTKRGNKFLDWFFLRNQNHYK